jgi:hypothetical protein
MVGEKVFETYFQLLNRARESLLTSLYALYRHCVIFAVFSSISLLIILIYDTNILKNMQILYVYIIKNV